MPIVGSNILAGASGQAGGGVDVGDYSGKSLVISHGVANTQCITRTPSSAGNTKVWTHSVWVKRLKFGVSDHFAISSYGANDGIASLYFHGRDN